jgi:hypothetical protein
MLERGADPEDLCLPWEQECFWKTFSRRDPYIFMLKNRNSEYKSRKNKETAEYGGWIGQKDKVYKNTAYIAMCISLCVLPLS